MHTNVGTWRWTYSETWSGRCERSSRALINRSIPSFGRANPRHLYLHNFYYTTRPIPCLLPSISRLPSPFPACHFSVITLLLILPLPCLSINLAIVYESALSSPATELSSVAKLAFMPENAKRPILLMFDRCWESTLYWLFSVPLTFSFIRHWKRSTVWHFRSDGQLSLLIKSASASN